MAAFETVESPLATASPFHPQVSPRSAFARFAAGYTSGAPYKFPQRKTDANQRLRIKGVATLGRITYSMQTRGENVTPGGVLLSHVL